MNVLSNAGLNTLNFHDYLGSHVYHVARNSLLTSMYLTMSVNYEEKSQWFKRMCLQAVLDLSNLASVEQDREFINSCLTEYVPYVPDEERNSKK